jgi:hypothetical protein
VSDASAASNPFRDLEQFAWQKVYCEMQERSCQSNGRPRPMAEAAADCREKELELRRLCDAAIAAGRRTGFRQPAVAKRVEALRRAGVGVLNWEFPNLYPPRQRGVAPGEYLVEQLNRVGAAINPVHELAVSYAPATAPRGARQALIDEINAARRFVHKFPDFGPQRGGWLAAFPQLVRMRTDAERIGGKDGACPLPFNDTTVGVKQHLEDLLLYLGAPILELPPASRANGPPPDATVPLLEDARGIAHPPRRPDSKLSDTERAILKLCRRKAMKGETIASHQTVGLSFDHVRRVLARLVKEERLANGPDGYRTM